MNNINKPSTLEKTYIYKLTKIIYIGRNFPSSSVTLRNIPLVSSVTLRNLRNILEGSSRLA